MPLTDDVRRRQSISEYESLCLLAWKDLSAWQQDNHFIRTGYRPASCSYTTSLLSIVQLHNETINIHTHALGSLVFIYYLSEYPDASLLPFFFSAIICLTMSSTFHIFSNHSASVARSLNVADHASITLLIWGSFIPSLVYGFACLPRVRNGYILMITVIGFACLYTSFKPQFRTPAWRPFRSAMFVAMGLSAILPVVHGWMLFGLNNLDRAMGLKWLVAQGICYVLGAGIYAARTPERWKPGAFDLLGASHQIFHVFVVIAAACHLRGLLLAKTWNESVPESVRCYGL